MRMSLGTLQKKHNKRDEEKNEIYIFFSFLLTSVIVINVKRVYGAYSIAKCHHYMLTFMSPTIFISLQKKRQRKEKNCY